jgi:hypothetical protein
MIAVTLVSLGTAAVMGLVAWRVVREDRRRSVARVDALAAEIHASDKRVGIPDPFFARTPLRAGSPWAFGTVAVAVMALGSSVLLAVVLSSGWRAPAPAHAAAPAVAATALELESLEHELNRDRLTVRGVVRNPPGRPAIDRLTVVVLVFSHEGGFASSGRAIIDVRTLAPGAASPFTVDIPGVNDVGRYRISFRTDEGIVEHIDKREP